MSIAFAFHLFNMMFYKKRLPIIAAMLLVAALLPACWLKDKAEKCQEQIVGSWKSTDFDGPYPDEAAIYLKLKEDFTGEITFEYDNGDEETIDLKTWEINEDCNRFEFTDEDGDDADFEILKIEDDVLELKGDIYGDDYEIRFKRR